jgi:hypothetical protein
MTTKTLGALASSQDETGKMFRCEVQSDKGLVSPKRMDWHAGRYVMSCVILAACASASSAQAIKVTVDTGKEVNVMTNTSLGLPAVMYSGDPFSPIVVPYLKATGAVTLRYPGNHGIADIYHWDTRSFTPYKGVETPYTAPESDFGTFAQMVDKLGSAVVVVNYGTNAKGNGGGDPAEAAAWVAYANGDPADTKALGKDASGVDWKTVGFWAGLRGGDKMGIDDGYNFLRIEHPKPLNIKLWQIGDQIFDNGYYGGDNVGDPDLHGAVPASLKDFSKLKKDPKLSPLAVGTNVVEFAKAMKAVDPTIQVGVGLPTPPDSDKSTPDFNTTVLKKACSSLDFVTLDWAPTALVPPEYKVLDEAQTFTNSKDALRDILSAIIEEDKAACPKDHYPRVTFATAGVPSWAKPQHPVFTTLWIADLYPLLIESGSPNINWFEIYGDSMLSSDRKKFGPAYFGLQMVHIIARNPGDEFVSAASNNPKLVVHATKRRDGVVGLMFVNEDPSSPASVQVSIAGTKLAATGKRFDYGLAQQTAGTGLAQSDMNGLGSDFALTIPPYTVTVLLVAAAK